MLNKENILGIIADHQKKIDELEKEMEKAKILGIDVSKLGVENELSFLRDNKYRYEMQARAWKLID